MQTQTPSHAHECKNALLLLFSWCVQISLFVFLQKKMKNLAVLGTVLVVAATAAAAVAPAPADRTSPQVLHKIAFGSCNRPDKNQSIWNAVAREKADVFMWTGDVVYA
jgi:hypothetical protein